MENEENMEPGFAKELKKFASYATLVIGALAWLDNRYMGSHKELLATMETHHMEVVALEKDVIKLDKDVEYMKIDLDQLLSNNNKKDGTDNQPSRSTRATASLFAVPPKEQGEEDKRKQYLSAL
jgi:hypothetical protein